MCKKLLVSFIIFMFVLVPIQVQAQELEGQVTALSLNEKAPFSGVLLDPIAAAKMIVNQKYLRAEIELELRKEFQKELSGKRLSFDLLKVDYVSLKKIHEETLLIKNEQINDLSIFLEKEISNDNNHWFAFGGMMAGIVLSVAVFYASVEIVK
tara:strand:+ start:261 stop:719 length:459 start_codon:yes stop_codon:yes gene_type:complete